MKDLYALVDRAIEECEAIGITPGEIVNLKVNTRAKFRWGQTRLCPDRTYEININEQLLNDDVPDNVTMSTIVHEVLHTCYGCMNHKAQWTKYAKMMNEHYGYNVKRTTSSSEKGIELPKHTRRPFKYVVTCLDCGHEYYYTRRSNVIREIEYFGSDSGCRCGRCKSSNLWVDEL